MRLSMLSLTSFFAVSFLGLMVLSPSNAHTLEERELGAFALGAGTITPGQTGPNAATPLQETQEIVGPESGSEPELDGNAATPETDANAETEPGTQSEPNNSAAKSVNPKRRAPQPKPGRRF